MSPKDDSRAADGTGDWGRPQEERTDGGDMTDRAWPWKTRSDMEDGVRCLDGCQGSVLKKELQFAEAALQRESGTLM